MKRKSGLAVLAAVGLTAVVVVPAPAGSAPVLGCGSVVRTDVTLAADIEGCEGDGLVVGSDGITIDLGHHRISGRFPGTEAPGTVGVRIGSHRRVTVKGAPTDPSAPVQNAIVGFETAVLLGDGAQRNAVTGLNLRGSRFGVAVRNATRNRIEGNSIAFAGGERPEPCEAGPDAEAGIALLDSRHNTVRGNTAQLGLFGILLDRSHGNTVAANEAAPTWSDGNQCDGIALFASHDNRVVDNIAANNFPHGIRVAPGSGANVVRGNLAFQNAGDGIYVGTAETTVSRNTATHNQGWGINAVPGVSGSGNQAAHNTEPAQCLNVVCQAPRYPSTA